MEISLVENPTENVFVIIFGKSGFGLDELAK